jgi:hypothetical protein
MRKTSARLALSTMSMVLGACASNSSPIGSPLLEVHLCSHKHWSTSKEVVMNEVVSRIVEVILLMFSMQAGAMSLQPCLTPTQFEDALKGAEQQGRKDGRFDRDGVNQFFRHLAEPSHERMTILSMVDTDEEAEPLLAAFDCGRPPFANVIRGVRWNDDPAFHMKWYTIVCAGGLHARKDVEIKAARNPLCFGASFVRASNDAKTQVIDGAIRKGQFPHSLLGRSHFGDLQFLHAMASQRDRNAAETYSRIMGWAELAYGVSIEDSYFSGGKQLRELGRIPAMQKTFQHNGWAISYLFDNERRTAIRADIAFGTLLHVVQDSFAPCHTQRDEATKQLTKFYSYGAQDKEIHQRCDRWATWMMQSKSKCHPVSIGRELRHLRERRANWTEAMAVLNSCLAPSDDMAKPLASDECMAGRPPQICQ